MKKVEILYFEGCPHYQGAVDLVRQVARELGQAVEIVEVRIESPEEAKRLRFLGSPTVRVDGIDIEPAARASTDYALACRTYEGSGLPPRSLVASALSENLPHGVPSGEGKAAAGAGVLVAAAGASALLASACCLGPLLLAAGGLSAAGTVAFFAPARPYLLALTALLLAAALYRSYFQQAAATAQDCCGGKPKGRRLSRLLLWVAVGIVALVALFPIYGGSLLRAGG